MSAKNSTKAKQTRNKGAGRAGRNKTRNRIERLRRDVPQWLTALSDQEIGQSIFLPAAVKRQTGTLDAETEELFGYAMDEMLKRHPEGFSVSFVETNKPQEYAA